VATSKEPPCLSGPTRCEEGYDSCHAAESVRRPTKAGRNRIGVTLTFNRKSPTLNTVQS